MKKAQIYIFTGDIKRWILNSYPLGLLITFDEVLPYKTRQNHLLQVNNIFLLPEPNWIRIPFVENH